jgi:hypothetical protein
VAWYSNSPDAFSLGAGQALLEGQTLVVHTPGAYRLEVSPAATWELSVNGRLQDVFRCAMMCDLQAGDALDFRLLGADLLGADTLAARSLVLSVRRVSLSLSRLEVKRFEQRGHEEHGAHAEHREKTVMRMSDVGDGAVSDGAVSDLAFWGPG